MGSLFQRITLAVMIGVALWVTTAAVRIEIQNAAASYYLPRRDDESGKWRMSRENTPRDRLRGLVSTVGLWQYFLAPVLMALVAVQSARRGTPTQRALGFVSGVVAVISLGLAFYRGYFSSLGL
jgi:hypothetical protein